MPHILYCCTAIYQLARNFPRTFTSHFLRLPFLFSCYSTKHRTTDTINYTFKGETNHTHLTSSSCRQVLQNDVESHQTRTRRCLLLQPTCQYISPPAKQLVYVVAYTEYIPSAIRNQAIPRSRLLILVSSLPRFHRCILTVSPDISAGIIPAIIPRFHYCCQRFRRTRLPQLTAHRSCVIVKNNSVHHVEDLSRGRPRRASL